MRLRSVAGRAEQISGTDPLAIDTDAAPEVRFLRAATDTMPMTWGWRRPVVLLPSSFRKWDRERQTVTIQHELAHIKRSDWLTQTLAQLVGALYWFHPLVWLGLRRMRIEADRACDDMVLRAGVKASSYAGHLLEVAREFRRAGLRPWVAIAMAWPSTLDQRVHYVLDSAVERAGLGRRGQLAAALGVAALVLSVPSVEAVGQTGTEPPLPPVSVQQAPAIKFAPVVAPEPPLPAERADRVAPPRRAQVLLAQAQPVPAPPLPPEPPLWPADEFDQDRLAQVNEQMREADEEMRRASEEIRRTAEELRRQEIELGRRNRPAPLSAEAMQTAATALRKALSSPDADVRAEAAEALGDLGSSEPANLEALSAALADAEPEVQRSAAESLGQLLRSDSQMPPDEALRWLTPAIESADAQVRAEAAQALGGLRGPRAIELAIRMTEDAEPAVQRQALSSLRRLLRSSDAETARAALPALQRALSHEDPQVRRQVVETLGTLRSIAEEVIPLLAAAAEDPDPEVQRGAVEALGNISASRGALPRRGGLMRGFASGIVGGVARGVAEGIAADINDRIARHIESRVAERIGEYDVAGESVVGERP